MCINAQQKEEISGGLEHPKTRSHLVEFSILKTKQKISIEHNNKSRQSQPVYVQQDYNRRADYKIS